jgi:hypothetical protein
MAIIKNIDRFLLRLGIILFIILGAIFVSMLSSCTPAERLKSILKKNPNLISTTHDTVYKREIYTTKEASKDTIFSWKENEHDTVMIKEGNLRVEYYHVHDSVVIKGMCDTLRIIERIPIQVDNTTKIVTAGKSWWQAFKDNSLLVVCGMFLVIIIYIVLKVLKKLP